ncbi:hypothetical protein BDQ12DRAFT_673637 [Crucibulum laeve]|uniref:Uncharacterized protein n=1 Tax=Crucibulum laeve TaxID=68775 RepID=A0A5C3MJH0_9AGAR|nr:hypothetical protein BDQ12DRAFT_673637 [Crucibulum laeve]
MESSFASSRRVSDFPKPETGLAEWTSKIKAMQRQVDADEEAEQKRLEEEIAASRLARIRRSRGVGYPGHADSVDLSGSQDQLDHFRDRNERSEDVSKSNSERSINQEDALQKLLGDAPTVTSSASQKTQPTSSTKPEPVSLAAFIGGRATGPRLNRHTPQSDAHDPTKYVQPNTSNPHPIFGRGGVAMPGMATKKVQPIHDDAVERYQPSSKRLSVPSVAQRYVEKVEERPVSPQKTGGRERTLSTPSFRKKEIGTQERPTSPFKNQYTADSKSKSPVITPAAQKLPQSPSNLPKSSPSLFTTSQSPAPTRPRSTAGDASTLSPTTAFDMHRPVTPRQPHDYSPTLLSSQKSPVTTPSLARPIQPDPRPTSESPKIPATVAASPAFLRPTTPKDPTPSISRLQGRGFVQNMVRASSKFDTPPSSAPASTEKPRPTGRKSTVLDRWQPNLNPTSSPSPSPTSHSFPIRRSVTVDPKVAVSQSPSPTLKKSSEPIKPLKTMLSLPSFPKTEPLSLRKAQRVEKVTEDPALGSATTMVVFKPEKAQGSPTEFAMVDELGIKVESTNFVGKHTVRFQEPVADTGKSLVHPTKSRARKPKKNKDPRVTPGPGKTTIISSGSEAEHPSQVGKRSESDLFSTNLSRSGNATSRPLPSTPSLVSSVSGPTLKVSQLAEKWATGAPIGVKPMNGSKPAIRAETKPLGMIRHALPGMTSSTVHINTLDGAARDDQLQPPSNPPALNTDTPVPISPISSPTQASYLAPNDAKKGTPTSPTRHTRIPSTGNRATVMDVAQALREHSPTPEIESVQSALQVSPDPEEHSYDWKPPSSVAPSSNSWTCSLCQSPNPNSLHAMDKCELCGDRRSAGSKASSSGPPASPARRAGLTDILSEKRRSSYERYSAVVLPPLKEELTPASTPNGTLSRNGNQYKQDISRTIQTAESVHSNLGTSSKQNLIHLDYEDAPLPEIDINALLKTRDVTPSVSSDGQTISVDVMSIMGNSSSSLSQNTDIFYDSEVLAIIHRSKSKSSGLANTTIWGWKGKASHFGEKEERKLQDLAKRYSTNAIIVNQYSEPTHLVHVLGGQLTIRQGSRAHWTADNTAMYLIRSYNGVIFIDEHDLSVKNLCSGFSYCLTILDAVYIWHGRGSTALERQAAVWYGQSLNKVDASPVELFEGEDDNDEMFWMILGEDEFAKADYWQWRRTSAITDPKVWKVDATLNTQAMVPVNSLSSETAPAFSVFVLDCIWELFVVVGKEARGRRQDIRLALSIAMQLAQRSSSARPYTPTVHVVVLPSKLPLDLRMSIRDIDERLLNDNAIPDHMNLLSCSEARGHLQRRSWEEIALKDETMLPLGVNVSDTA